MRRVGRILLGLGPVVLFVLPHVLWGRPPVSEIPIDAFFDDVTGLVLVFAGLVAWDRRPTASTGPLLIGAGYLWYVGSTYQYVPPESPLQYVSFILRGYYEPILAFVILSFPGGRLELRRDRIAVVAMLAILAIRSLWRLIGVHPGFAVPREAPPNPAWLLHDGATVVRADQIMTAALGVALLAVAGLAVQRRSRIRPGARRPADPVLLGGAIYAAVAGAYATTDLLQAILGISFLPLDGPGWTAQYLMRTLAPLGFLVGSFRLRRGTAAVVQLMTGASGLPRGVDLQEALRRALDDPGLALLYAGRAGWEDAEGRPAMLPGPDASVTATILQADGHLSGALVHDRTLLDDPSLLPTVSATLRLAIDNDRLQDDLREQLVEIRASRARVVEAADGERRRLERDLHDGAQQRLVSLAVTLRTIQSRLGQPLDPLVSSELEAAAGDVRAAIDELRELARGLDPAILRQAGLEPALRSLADRSPVPVQLDVDVADRLPAKVETATYFVVSEALTNVAKHAAASRATVRVDRRGERVDLAIGDDGSGGADPAGSGLRGLADRVAALDGTFRVVSLPGGGTSVEASIPCGS
ncbi:MAG: sensor histidine kinase [Chloroflexi bacterium]|nr:sensor histidine kinase [Chloroflexota bacterium]